MMMEETATRLTGHTKGARRASADQQPMTCSVEHYQDIEPKIEGKMATQAGVWGYGGNNSTGDMHSTWYWT